MLFDPIRQKMVAHTPEEHVRQTVVRWLVEERGVPPHLMETEFALCHLQKGNRGRVDVLVHGFRSGMGVTRPWLLVECKRPGETDWEALQVQVNRYLRVLQPRHILLGLGDQWRLLSFHSHSASYIAADALPDFPG